MRRSVHQAAAVALVIAAGWVAPPGFAAGAGGSQLIGGARPVVSTIKIDVGDTFTAPPPDVQPALSASAAWQRYSRAAIGHTENHPQVAVTTWIGLFTSAHETHNKLAYGYEEKARDCTTTLPTSHPRKCHEWTFVAANTGKGLGLRQQVIARVAAGLHPGRESFFAPPPEGDLSPHGPALISRPSCTPGQIEAVAFTEPSPDGVLGVVELEGTKRYHEKHFGDMRCAIPIAKGPQSFVAASGQTLDVPLGRADKTNPAANVFGSRDVYSGKAAWGFGWFGTSCGAAPRYVVMKLKGDRGSLDVPYDGPTPPCPSAATTTSSSTLTDGTSGGAGSPVQPAPPSYNNLTTSARFVGPTTHTQVAPVEVTISDTSTQPVELTPCPTYLVQGTDRTGKRTHFVSEVGSNRSPGCNDTTVTVRPNQPVTFRVTRDELSPGTTFGAPKGSTFDASVELAGMPTASASTTVE